MLSARKNRSILGLDIGGTNTACVECAFDATILQRIEMPTNARQPFDATLLEPASKTAF